MSFRFVQMEVSELGRAAGSLTPIVPPTPDEFAKAAVALYDAQERLIADCRVLGYQVPEEIFFELADVEFVYGEDDLPSCLLIRGSWKFRYDGRFGSLIKVLAAFAKVMPVFLWTRDKSDSGRSLCLFANGETGLFGSDDTDWSEYLEGLFAGGSEEPEFE